MSTSSVIPAPSSNQVVKPAEDMASKGLTSDEARIRLEKDGPNAMPDTSAHPLRNAVAKFWAPVPWLLEVSIVLEIVLHKDYEAAVIAALLVFNAALAYFQESRAQATLAALKSRLALNASVLFLAKITIGCRIKYINGVSNSALSHVKLALCSAP